MDIVLGIDNAFVMPAGILIMSIIRTQGDTTILFHVLSDGVSEHNKGILRSIVDKNKYCSIVFYEIDDNLLKTLPVRNHLSRACYCRLFVTEFLPPTLSKVLYLDSDMLVVDSLKALWETEISNFSVAVAIDQSYDDIMYINTIGYHPENGYFNSGMMLINLDYWRKNNIPLKTLDFIHKHHANCFWNDQDAFNYVTAGTRKLVSYKYNMSNLRNVETLRIRKEYHEDVRNSQKNPVIIHYAGSVKPWHRDCHRYYYNYKTPWLSLKKQSPWANTKLGCSPDIRIAIRTLLIQMFLFIFGSNFLEKLTPIKTKSENDKHKESLNIIYERLK